MCVCVCVCVQVMLDRLNDIVWPEIWKLVEVKVQDAGRQGYKVCVVDAAVMVMAGWHCRVHQVWTTICPRKEVRGRGGME